MLECQYCGKSLSRSDSVKRHEAKCKNKSVIRNISEGPSLKKDNYSKKDKSIDISLRKSSDNPPINRKFKCSYCMADYGRLDNLKRHEVKCSRKEINDMKKEVTHTKELLEIYKQEMQYYKDIADQAGEIAKYAMSGIKYLMNVNYDAPNIQEIEKVDIEALDDYVSNDDLISNLFSAYKNRIAHKFLGDMIVKIYKKKNPKDQSIWTTDVSRMTYTIKQDIGKNNSKWTIDKKGVETTSYLITPLLEEIKILSREYHEKMCMDVENPSTSKVMMINEIYAEIMRDIDNKILHWGILKYIASHLYLNIKDKKKKNKKVKKIKDKNN
jgi:hypothetical protein